MNAFSNFMSVDSVNYDISNSAQSERFRREAIYHFEKKLSEEPKCVEALCGWINNYHELSIIYKQQGNIQTAQKCLIIPHQTALQMANNSFGDQELEIIGTRAMRITLPPLLAFAQEHPPCESCMAELNAQMSRIEEQRKFEH